MYGLHAVTAALANPERHLHEVRATKNALARLPDTYNIRDASPAEIDRLLPEGAVHQGVAARVDPLDPPLLEAIMATGAPLLILDQVSDPHNIGAILRTAAAFGVGAVLLPRDHTPGESAVMAKTASGALDIVPLITIGNLAATLKDIKQGGYWTAGLDGQAEQPLHEAKLTGKTALILGAEGKGMRRLTAELCDFLVNLPMDGRMESLNVSNAAAIALYELFRQQQEG